MELARSPLGRDGLVSSPSSDSYEVSVISAFGRGDLLASELKTRGFEVALIDVSQSLGERSIAELEGPFPLVRPSPLLASHLEWLMLRVFPEVGQGLCLWMNQGPVDFRGPLADFYLRKHPAAEFFRKYSIDWLQGGQKRAEILKSLASDFSQSWMINFAHSFASHQFLSSIPPSRLSFYWHDTL